jgi:predicted Zn-ribbon and HTH transcriptional regulator
MKDLGTANGWQDTPVAYEQCHALKHTLKAEKLGAGLTEYSCEVCGFKFREDSSD